MTAGHGRYFSIFWRDVFAVLLVAGSPFCSIQRYIWLLYWHACLLARLSCDLLRGRSKIVARSGARQTYLSIDGFFGFSFLHILFLFLFLFSSRAQDVKNAILKVQAVGFDEKIVSEQFFIREDLFDPI